MALLARRRAARVAASLLACALLVAACGSRGPLDISDTPGPVADATADAPPLDAGPDGADAAADAPPDAPADSPPDVVDAAPEAMMGFDGGPIVNCVTCIGTSCGSQVLACVTSTTCRAALQCSAGCLTGGVPNIPCVENCTMGNTTTEEQLLTMISCVLTNCSTCLSALGGLGGL